ncbi:MAG: biotin/lipoyl-containing protein, partial [Rubrobacteraceae bacterium]
GSVTVAGEAPEKGSREVEMEVNGKLFRVRLYSDEQREGEKPQRRGGGARRAASSEGAVTAPMQGTIVKVLVEEGQELETDEPVCVLEAMKMESEIRARSKGSVREVHVQAGQTVRAGEPLITLD